MEMCGVSVLPFPQMLSEPVWSYIGKILALITGAAALYTLYERLFAPKAKLHATVSHTRFLLPKIVEDEYKKAAQLGRASTLNEAFTKENLAPYGLKMEQAERCTWLVETHFREKVPMSLPYATTGGECLWGISVTNGGRKRCQDVEVVIPRATMVFIERSGAKDEFRIITENVSLGTLLPKDEVKMTAWSHFYIYPDKVRLSHSTGDGAVKELLLTPKFWNWMSNNYMPFLLFIMGALAASLVQVSKQIAINEAKSAISTNSATGTITNSPTLKTP